VHRHVYVLGNKILPSVTEVLAWPPKPWLEKWQQKWGILAERKAELCGKIGNDFNDMLDAILWGEQSLKMFSLRVGRMTHNVREQFIEPYVFRPEVTQHHVVSEAYGYHGTLDAIGLVRGIDEFVIVDWKTSSAIHDDYMLQIAAYAKAYEEQHGIELKRGFVVRVDRRKPDHDVEIKQFRLTKALFKKFLTRLKKYNERNINEC